MTRNKRTVFSCRLEASVQSKDGDKVKVSKSYNDWDAVAKEADEIEEGDPLNNLFRKIFNDANDDTRRAMIKSFVRVLFASYSIECCFWCLS